MCEFYSIVKYKPGEAEFKQDWDLVFSNVGLYVSFT